MVGGWQEVVAGRARAVGDAGEAVRGALRAVLLGARVVVAVAAGAVRDVVQVAVGSLAGEAVGNVLGAVLRERAAGRALERAGHAVASSDVVVAAHALAVRHGRAELPGTAQAVRVVSRLAVRAALVADCARRGRS